jgi:glycosyltransferase involved in cell wall biosynthesis
MKSQPLVSVITPFYNTTPQFMREAIDSVLVQDYANWEILLVDDGSTGESTVVAREYAEYYPGQVRYLEHESHRNRGASASRNLGISHARGEYIAFLDADDVWSPHKLEQQVAILGAQPEAAMLYGNTQYWYSWTGRPEDSRRDFIPKLGVQPDIMIEPPKLLPLYLQGQAAVPCTCSVLLRRQIVNGVGGFECSFRDMYDDQAFYAKICLVAAVYIANTCWDRYRQHPASTCSIAERTKQSNSIRLTFLNWLAAYLSERGIGDTAVWQALRAELRRYDRSTWLNFRAFTPYICRRTRKLWGRITERDRPPEYPRSAW